MKEMQRYAIVSKRSREGRFMDDGAGGVTVCEKNYRCDRIMMLCVNEGSRHIRLVNSRVSEWSSSTGSGRSKLIGMGGSIMGRGGGAEISSVGMALPRSPLKRFRGPLFCG